MSKARQENDASLPRVDRIVLYIDDLDRCRAERVIEVLEAVHLLLAFRLFAVVVAVDPRWLRQSLLDHYPKLLNGGLNGKAGQSAMPAASPQDYLEKIFQVPFHLQAMEKAGYDALVTQLFQTQAPRPESGTRTQVPETRPKPPLSPSTEAAKTIQDESKDVVGRSGPIDEVARGKDAATVKIVPASSPIDPQRMTFTPKEVADLLRFQPLFETPRAVKRFANTYSLIRVGVGQDDWPAFIGSGKTPGDYRIPMLQLAVAAAFPSLARTWLSIQARRSRWELSQEEIDQAISLYAGVASPEEWRRLGSTLKVLKLADWPVPALGANPWTARVARYSF
jgi:hypothetical protein